jgi:hypothetical protein
MGPNITPGLQQSSGARRVSGSSSHGGATLATLAPGATATGYSEGKRWRPGRLQLGLGCVPLRNPSLIYLHLWFCAMRLSLGLGLQGSKAPRLNLVDSKGDTTTNSRIKGRTWPCKVNLCTVQGMTTRDTARGQFRWAWTTRTPRRSTANLNPGCRPPIFQFFLVE